MDTGSIKPAARTTRSGFPESRTNAQAPAARSPGVTPVAAVTGDTRDQAMRREYGHRNTGEVVIDPQIREAMSRGPSPRAGRAQRQDAALKLRAYRRPETPEEPDAHALEKTV
jgi:hypothetical protein